MIDSKDIVGNAKDICTFLELSIVDKRADKRAKKNPTYHIPFSNIPCLEYDCYGDEDSQPWIEVETHIRASDTLFHKDWNWLIKVINKFKEVWAKEGYESKSRELDKLAQDIYVDTIDIEYTYNACMKFIVWHLHGVK
jgi:hypothetical protein